MSKNKIAQVEVDLRNEIKNVLERITKRSAPNIHDKIQDENGYKTVEALIIKMHVKEAIPVSGCIMYVEEFL